MLDDSEAFEASTSRMAPKANPAFSQKQASTSSVLRCFKPKILRRAGKSNSSNPTCFRDWSRRTSVEGPSHHHQSLISHRLSVEQTCISISIHRDEKQKSRRESRGFPSDSFCSTAPGLAAREPRLHGKSPARSVLSRPLHIKSSSRRSVYRVSSTVYLPS